MADKIHFIITGLPRSGTAWLANYLSGGPLACIHDALAEALPSPDGLSAALSGMAQRSGAARVGICDAGAVHYQDALRAACPDAVWIAIIRPLPEVLASVRRLGFSIEEAEFLHTHQRKLEELLNQPGVMRISFHELFTDWGLNRIEEAVAQGEWRCPPWRRAQLLRTRVQADFELAMAAVRRIELPAAEPPRQSAANAAYLDVVRELCAGTPEAWLWYESLLETALVWDHLLDGDGVALELADRVLSALVLDWPRNRWWQAHAPVLLPVLFAALSAWRESNTPDAAKEKAYDIYTEVPTAMAWILHGRQVAAEYSARLRPLARAILADDEIADNQRK